MYGEIFSSVPEEIPIYSYNKGETIKKRIKSSNIQRKTENSCAQQENKYAK